MPVYTHTLYDNLQGIGGHVKIQPRHQKRLGGTRAAMFVYGMFFKLIKMLASKSHKARLLRMT